MRTAAVATASRAALLALGFALAAPVEAQQQVVTLSLDEAIETARRSSPAYARVLDDPAQARRVERQRYLALFPLLPSVSMSLGGSYSKQVTALDDFGNVVRVDTAVVSRSSSMGQSISIDLPPLWDGGQRLNQLRSARAGTRLSEAQLAQQEVNLRTQVSNAYLGVLERIFGVRLDERLLAAAVENLRLQEELFRVATTSRVDILGGRQDVAQRESDLARSRGELEKAKLQLLTTMGVEPRLDVELTDTIVPLFDPKRLDADSLVGRALLTHPEIAAADATVEQSQRQLAVSRGTRWPTLRPSLSYSRGIGRRSYQAWSDFEMPRNESFGFGLSVSVPLYDGLQRSTNIAAAEGALRDQQHNAREARLNVERDVRGGLIDLENAYRQLEISRLAAAIAAERLELATEQYRIGAGRGYTDLQQVIQQAASAERQVLSAQFQFARALVTLEQRVGGTVRP